MKKKTRKILAWIAVATCAVCLIRFGGKASVPSHQNNTSPKGDNHLECSSNIVIDANIRNSIA